MPPVTLGERLAAGAIGAIFGALIGAACAWLLGVYSSQLGAGSMHVSFKNWMLLPAAGFGISGLIFGSDVGTMIGAVIKAMYEFEKGADDPWPLLQLLFAVAVIAIGAWFLLR